MMRSLSSAVAGLRTHQTKMDVIGNNIANVNTNGFKGSRTTFADVFYQNLSTGSGATSSAGGTNPTQIGYGSSVATIDVMNTVAGAGTTGRELDVYLAGEGFLVSKDSSGKQMFTRLGNLGFDGEGNLVDGNGQFIQGFPQNEDGSAKISADGTITSGELSNIKVDPEILNKLKGISISKTGSIVGSMPGDPKITVESLPQFLNKEKISIPTDSNLQGDVKLMVGALPKITDFHPDLGVTMAEYGNKALPLADGVKHAYSMDYDSTTNLVTLKDTIEGSSYTGYVKDGKVTLQNPATKGVAMTLTLAPKQSVMGAPLQGDMLSGTDAKTPVPLTLANFNTALTGDATVTSIVPAELNFPAGGCTISADKNGNMTFQTPGAPPVIYTGKYDSNSKTVVLTSNGRTAITLGLTLTAAGTTIAPKVMAATEKSVTGIGALKYEVTTSDKGNNVVKLPATGPTTMPLVNGKLPLDGLMDIEIDTTKGPVIPTYQSIGVAGPGDEVHVNIGNLVTAKFRNPGGMMENGSSYFEATFNSGDAVYVMPGLDGTGEVAAGNLELSNVDVSKEFTDMITTQRGFQANSRIITVSDSMLEELVNLKR